MRMNRFVAALGLALAACGSPSAPSEKEMPTSSNATAVAEPSSATEPVAVVRQYLQWSKDHEDRLPHDFIVNGDGHDSTQFYAVNFPGTEEWLAAVKQSNLVSEAYLDKWRAYFRQYNDTLRLHPQYDGVPPGFEYEFLTLSQDPETQVAELLMGTFTLMQRSGAQVQVQARGPHHDDWQAGLDFVLSKGPDGRWMIDTIAPAESGQ